MDPQPTLNVAGSTRFPRKVGLVRHTTCQPIRNDTTQIYWLAPEAPPLMPPAAAPPLAAAGALIAPAPPAVSLPPVLPRLQPAAPALNITTTTTTMMCLIFDFIAFLLHGLPALPGGFGRPALQPASNGPVRTRAVVWVIHLLSTLISWVTRRRVDYSGAILVPIGHNGKRINAGVPV
jgi:hypothetical protein